MPPFSQCVTALISVSLVLCTGLLTSAPRDSEGGRDRDTVIRPARGGPQRLDTGDAVEHAADHDLIVWPAADGIDRSVALVAVLATPNPTGTAAPNAPAEASDLPRPAPSPVATIASPLSLQAHPLTRSGRLPLGRAPPLL